MSNGAAQAAQQRVQVQIVEYQSDRHGDAVLSVLARLAGKESVDQAIGMRYLQSILEADNSSLNVIEVNGRTAGILAIMNAQPLLGTVELAIAVTPEFDGTGIGRKVGNYALQYLFEEKGFQGVFTHCTTREGINLCRRLGMEPVEHIVTMQMTKEGWDGLSAL